MDDQRGLGDLIDGQRLGGFNVALLAWSFLAMLADGFDIAALASAAPALSRTWEVAPKDFAPALTASLVGILFGAPLLGAIGDRAGRRIAVIAGTFVFGLGTLATIWAGSITQITALRFVTGIGIGGLMPNLIALNAELQPKRWRAPMIVLMFTGITAGSGLPGAIQAWLIPLYGWPVMFLIGGIAPLVVGVLLVFYLPESVRFLATRPFMRARLIAMLGRMRPDLSIADGPALSLAEPVAAAGSGLPQLFGSGMAAITGLLWVCFACALMANYFLVSWLPLLLETHGLAPREAGLATSLYHYGGLLGGVLVSFVLARFGFAAIAVLFGLAIPAVAAIGLQGATFATMAATIALAGFFVLGSQFGNNAASGLLYPAGVRSRGVGWALGIGRFGSIAGPLVGGALIAMRLPLDKLFLLAAVPLAVGVTAAVVVAALCHRRFGGFTLDDSVPRRPCASP